MDPETLVEQIMSTRRDDPKAAASEGEKLGCAMDFAISEETSPRLQND